MDRLAARGEDQLFPAVAQPAGVLERENAVDGAVASLEGRAIADEQQVLAGHQDGIFREGKVDPRLEAEAGQVEGELSNVLKSNKLEIVAVAARRKFRRGGRVRAVPNSVMTVIPFRATSARYSPSLARLKFVCNSEPAMLLFFPDA